jgi:hypothetical protein
MEDRDIIFITPTLHTKWLEYQRGSVGRRELKDQIPKEDMVP